MKTRNKLLTLLIQYIRSSCYCTINKAIKLSATSEIWKNQRHCVLVESLGNIIHYTKTEQVNRFCW